MADEISRGMSDAEPVRTTSGAPAFDSANENSYWKEHYSTRPYAMADRGYDYYQPAYQYGWESAERYRPQPWHAVESDLRTGWDKARGQRTSTWEEVKHAVRDAWDRVTGRV